MNIAAKLSRGILAVSVCAGLSAQTTFSNANGSWKVTTSGNTIDIEFDPHATNVNCPKIGFAQTVKWSLDGMVVTKPSTVIPEWAYKDDDILTNGWRIDHVFCEKDPYYNGDDCPQDGSSPQQGSSQGSGGATTKSEMSDSPYTADVDFPTGKTMSKLEFEMCAVCMEGPNAGTVYGCIKWKYERTKGGDAGTVTLLSTAVEAQSQDHKDALAKYVTNHGSGASKMCPEDLPAGNCGNRYYSRKGPMVFHVNDNYEVRSSGSGVKKGRKSRGINMPIGNSLVACDYVFVPKGERICIRRKRGPSPAHATYVDLYRGECETVETGQCAGNEHCGVQVWSETSSTSSATSTLIATVEPTITGNAETLVMYTVAVDEANALVIVRNDPLSSDSITAVDNLGGLGSQILLPGQSTVFPHPGNVSNFGVACQGSNGLLPEIGATGRAAPGFLLDISLSSAVPFVPAFLMLDATPTDLPLTPFGLIGCTLYVLPVVSVLSLTDYTGSASVPLAIPNNAAFLGAAMDGQWFILEALPVFTAGLHVHLGFP